MCMTCLDDPNEFREYMKDLIYAEYAKEDLVRTNDGLEAFAGTVRYLSENRDEHDYTDEQLERLIELVAQMTALDTEEEREPLIEEFKEILKVGTSDISGLMKFDYDPLRGPTEATIMDDLKAFPDEELHEQLIRAIQHTYYYHETRPEYLNLMLGQNFVDAIGRRMAKYAEGSMEHVEGFRSAMVVIDEEEACYALATIMTGVYLEALFAGYYAGAKGQDCPMWFTHELGPVGRQDTRPMQEKLPEVITRMLANMTPPDAPQGGEEKGPE